MAELKPCPFCGGEADYRTENFERTVWVKCTVCGIATGRYETDEIVDGMNGKAWVTKTWNRRTIG